MMTSGLRSALTVVGAMALCCGALTGCGGGTEAARPAASAETTRSTASQAPAAQEGQASTIVIDVRSPEEYAAGHIKGAVNIDFNADDFGEQIAALDPGASYAVYCRSGNRSAQAVKQMRAAGLNDVADAGAMSEASESLGKPVVTE